MTRASTEDNCAKLQDSFLILQSDDAHCKATESSDSKAAKAIKDVFLEESKKDKTTTPANSGKNCSVKLWKENTVDETDKSENEEANNYRTLRGSGDTTQECGTDFRTLLQQLAPATFKMVENQSFGE